MNVRQAWTPLNSLFSHFSLPEETNVATTKLQHATAPEPSTRKKLCAWLLLPTTIVSSTRAKTRTIESYKIPKPIPSFLNPIQQRNILRNTPGQKKKERHKRIIRTSSSHIYHTQVLSQNELDDSQDSFFVKNVEVKDTDTHGCVRVYVYAMAALLRLLQEKEPEAFDSSLMPQG